MLNRPSTLVSTPLVALLLVPAIAGAAVEPVPNRSATALAEAMSSQRGLVRSAHFSAIPPWSNPAAISTTRLAGFPVSGGDRRYAILSTGDATLTPRGNDSTFTGREAGGPSIRGGFDVTIVRVSLRVPRGARCLTIDLRMLSDEYKEALGTPYGDTFVAEVGTSNWRVTDGADPSFNAPNNFARGPDGSPVTISKTGLSSMTVGAARGTTYDGATRRLRIATPVSAGDRLLYLSLMDRGDRLYDTAVFLDNLRTTTSPSCSTRAIG